ncbi:MAG: transglutaminase domain-containing protein [Victivallales bacterium]|jgi:transglutaminase-like putative cysteine protease
MAENAKSGQDLSSGKIAVHFLSTVFFALASVSSVWQYANPMLAHMLIVFSAVSALSIFISTRIISLFARKIIQVIILCLAIAWAVHRAASHITVEIFLIEFLCISGLSFGLTLSMKDYGIQCLVGIILLICGSVFPRSVFIYLLPFAFLTCMLFVYTSRPLSLSGDLSIKFSLNPIWKNRNYFLLHFLLAVMLWIYFCTFFPSPSKTGFGFISSSTLNNNLNYLPPEYDKWFRSEIKRESETGESFIDSPLKPSASGKTESVSQDIDNPEDSVEGDGSGAGPPGNDLVFRVKSPVKTYWLAALYDSYDGHKWTATKAMKTQKIRGAVYDFSGNIYTQNYFIDKKISPTLYGAFMPRSFDFPPGVGYKTETTFYNSRILNPESITVPFSYNVTSINCTSDNTVPDFKPAQLWFEKLPQKHYTALPKNTVSGRVQKLSARITYGEKDSYKKAILLRDYLRENFKYRADAMKTPGGKEVTDYFIFELKEGNCQYFANSLAVMARTSGIPSRLATGFSPGNYNILNGTFEVYEYHAHAWTQLFIEGKGWLTFDATPPGEVTSRTTPLIIGALEDPFGDEWKVTPPELTKSTRDLFAEKIRPMAEKTKDAVPLTKIQKIAISIPTSKEELNVTINKLTGAPQGTALEKNKKIGKLKNMGGDIKKNAIAMMNYFLAGIKSMAFRFFSFQGLLLQLIVLVLFISYRFFLGIRAFANRRRRRRRCLRMLDEIQKSSAGSPAERIGCCYKLTRELLEISGLKREKNMELLNYGISLKKTDYNLSRDALAVFFIYSKASYSPSAPEAEDAEVVMQRILRIRNNLSDNLKLL